ncbi:CST complex subunit STN1-like isoform X2 [Ruditapes philippinarum]|nr:CST complex subunit STN1-like isoform X2 [Ruditapes philippinarum]
MACLGSESDLRESPLEFYPPKMWGLDYHFNVYNKMYVKDILEMQEYPHFTGAFSYKNHPIYKVDVLGVVVKKVENSKCFIYAVDDGTGCILCCCWKDNFYSHTGTGANLDLPPTLQHKIDELDTYTASVTEGYILGDLIQVKGKLKIFRDKKEVVATIHKKVTDPQFQVFRICELPRLYNQRYDRRFQLPYKVQQALKQHRQDISCGTTSETSIIYDLKTVIFEYISKSNCIIDLPVNDLLQYSKVKDILSKLNDGKVS